MKKLLVLLTFAMLFFTSCNTASKSFSIDGKTVEAKPYGLFTESRKVSKVNYEVSARNVILAIIFSETVIVPVYVIGWDLFVPIELE